MSESTGMIHTMEFWLVPPLGIGWHSRRITRSYQLPIDQGRIKLSIIHRNWVKSHPLPLVVAGAGVVIAARLVSLLLLTMLLLWLLLNFSKSRCYMSHLVLVNSWSDFSPLHRGPSFNMGGYNMSLPLLLPRKSSILLC
jgi:hypothetical protein